MPQLNTCRVCGGPVIAQEPVMDRNCNLIVPGTDPEFDDIHPECHEKLLKALDEKIQAQAP